MKKLKKRLLSFATCMALIFSMLAFLPDMFSINAEAFTEKTSWGGNSDPLWTYIRQCPYYNGKAECTIYAWSRVYQITGKLPAGLNGLGNAGDWYKNCTAYPKDKTNPKVGDVVCWGRNYNIANGNWGHVAVIERISGGTIYFTEAWGGNNNDWFHQGSTNSGRGYSYQMGGGSLPLEGFIHVYDDGALTTPTITTDRISSSNGTSITGGVYGIGDTVNFSWAATTGSNLSHYEVKITNPSGTAVVNTKVTGKTNYSYKPTAKGIYTIKVTAVPKDSSKGKALSDSKTVSIVDNMVAPKITLDKAVYSKGDTVNVKWVVSNTGSAISGYWLNVTAPDGSKVYSGGASVYNSSFKDFDMKNGKYSFKADKTGTYTVKVSAVPLGKKSDSEDLVETAKVVVVNSTTPQLGSDGWYYADVLPSGITSDKYEIQYQNTYEKVSSASPGTGWVKGSLAKSQYENSGDRYLSYIELPTSNTRQLVSYYWYHYCGVNAGQYANFKMDSKYTHYDEIRNVNSVIVAETFTDVDDSRYKYYKLKWNDGTGNYAWCATGATCDGTWGSHGSRSCSWYKACYYQDKVKVDYYNYTKQSDWTTQKDNTAVSVKVRYRKAECKHTYTSKVTKAATCIATGTKTYTCSKCGDSYTEVIAKTAHNYSTSWTIDKAATCTAEGSKSHHCTVCGAKKDVTAIAKTAHKYTTSVVAPTPTQQGYTLHTCSVCKYSYKDNYTNYQAAATMSGKLVIKGAAVTDASVVMKNSAGQTVNASVKSDGTFTFSKVSDGTYTVTVSRKNCPSRDYTVKVQNGKAPALNFELKLYGDVNGDGILTVFDVMPVNKCAQKTGALDGYDFKVADVTNDNKLDVFDCMKINAHIKKTALMW